MSKVKAQSDIARESLDIDLSEVVPLSEKRPFSEKIKNILPAKRFFALSLIVVFLLVSGSSVLFLWIQKKHNFTRSRIQGEQTLSQVSPHLEPHAALPSSTLKERIGFLPSWMVAKKVKVYPERLSQIIYFGLGVNEQGELIQYNEEGVSVLEWTYFHSDYFTDVRKEASASGTKILLAIKCFDNETIDNLTSNQTATDNLIKRLLKIIEEYQLDGVNIDFEYVTDTDFPTVKYYNRFLETLSQRLYEENPALIISVDVNANAVLKDGAYDLVKIGEVADQVILMAYDYHRAASTRAGPVAPIEAGENEHNISESLQALAGRVPFEKVILGVPFYGYEWQTINSNYKSPTVANTGALATYRRVSELIDNRDDLEINWDEQAQSPWLVYRQSGAIKQIYYENEQSLQAKLNLVGENNLGGIAIWALGYEGGYPDLWQIISEKLGE